MNYEKICKLVDGIIESEYNNVQQFRETGFIDDNKEQKSYEDNSRELFNKLEDSLSNEQQVLLREYSDSIVSVWENLCRFYFKEGIATGLSNLSCLTNIDGVVSYIR